MDQRPPSRLDDVLADKTFAGGLMQSIHAGGSGYTAGSRYASRPASLFPHRSMLTRVFLIRHSGTLGRSFFAKLPAGGLLFEEEELSMCEDLGDVTIVHEMESPQKRPGQEDEAAGVFGGKVTEREQAEKKERLKSRGMSSRTF